MFLNSKTTKAIEFSITVLESMGMEVKFPDLQIEGNSKTEVLCIRWWAMNAEGKYAAHISLVPWGKKLKIIIWLPKNPREDDASDIDHYVVLGNYNVSPYLELPHGRGKISLHKIDPSLFFNREEMRLYLGY